MINAATYLEHVRRDGGRIADVADGNLDKPVPSCPGLTVEKLLQHTGSLYVFWSEALIQNKQPEIDWAAVMAGDVLDANRGGLDRFTDTIGTRDADEPTWTWANLIPGAPAGTVRFWYRRAAQELAVHRWDFENAIGEASGIDAALAMDGIDEFLFVFGPATGHPQFKGGSERFEGNGETFRLEPTDFPDAVTFTAHADRFELTDSAPDVTARGTASDLLLFMWGRIPPSTLDVTGDASLLALWQERVKI
jgi:uncharacterized protein (TIGR03083 family)